MILKKALLENEIYSSGLSSLHGVLSKSGSFRVTYKESLYVVVKVFGDRTTVFDYEKDRLIEEYHQLKESGELDEIMKMRLYL